MKTENETIDDAATSSSYRDFERAIFGVDLFLVMSGVPANTFSLYAFHKLSSMESFMRRLLMAISVCDSMALITKTVFDYLSLISSFGDDANLFKCYAIVVAKNVSRELSAVLLVVLSIERAIAIIYPLKVKTYFDWRMKSVSLTFMLLFLLVKTLAIAMVDFDSSCYVLLTDRTSIGMAWGGFMLPLFSLIVFAPLIICNSAILIKLNRRRQQATTISNISQRSEQNAKVLIALSVLFLVTSLPENVLSILRLVKLIYLGELHPILYGSAVTISLSNNFINFIVYLIMLKDYRDLMFNTFKFIGNCRN